MFLSSRLGMAIFEVATRIVVRLDIYLPSWHRVDGLVMVTRIGGVPDTVPIHSCSVCGLANIFVVISLLSRRLGRHPILHHLLT